MRKFITFALLLLVACPLYADTIERYRNLKSCVFAEDLGDYHAIDKKYTITPTVTLTDSIFGKAMSFDGNSAYIDIGDNPELEFGTGAADEAFTVCGWIEVVASANAQYWVSKLNYTVANKEEWDITLSAIEKIAFRIWDDSASVSSTRTTAAALSAGWHFVAITYDGTGGVTACNGATIYVDGVSVDSTANNNASYIAMEPGSASVFFGAFLNNSSPTSFWIGDMGKQFIFNRALSATEIEQVYKGTAFDYEIETVLKSDCSQINPVDLYGSFNGTGTGLAAANITEGHRGGKAIQFNGTDEKVDFGDVGTISSVSMWVNPLSTTEELFLVDTDNDVMLNAGTVTYATLTKVNTFVDGVDTDTMVANKWQHLVCVFTAVDANNFELANDGTNFGNIEVDSVTAYSGALEQAEAEDIYARSR